MAVRGSGPSRRSHTKSRKGCKTCKKRHIRCDESFPHCRNCTKHRVTCDYLEARTPDSDSISQSSSVRTSPTPTPTIEDVRGHRHFHSDPIYGDFGAMPPVPLASLGSDPDLIQNLYSIAISLDTRGVSDLTPWVGMIRRHLDLAPSFPMLLDALKAFSAGQLAWVSSTSDYRQQGLVYANNSLNGLHEAVGRFNKTNADAVLVTSMLLATQSREWSSWSSLLSGLKSITAAMGSWQNEALYPDLVAHMNSMFAAQPEHYDGMEVKARSMVLQELEASLRNLQPFLDGRHIERHWVAQFVDLVQRLQVTEPARTAEEGFSHMYVLRKWVFWLPVLLLQEGPLDMTKLAVLAHLYAMPLVIGPTFPRLGESMCGYAASTPLANVLGRMSRMHADAVINGEPDVSALMLFPQTTLNGFNVRNPWSPTISQPELQIPDISMYLTDENSMPGNLSPAFAPATYVPAHSRDSSAASTFLSVPTPTSGFPAPVGFTQTFSQWGTFPSPSMPSQEFFSDESLFYSDDDQNKQLPGGFGGFLQPCEIWT